MSQKTVWSVGQIQEEYMDYVMKGDTSRRQATRSRTFENEMLRRLHKITEHGQNMQSWDSELVPSIHCYLNDLNKEL
jgi:hypothetical protein